MQSIQGGLKSGGLTEVQVSGIRTRSGNIEGSERRELIKEIRMEGFRVVSAMADTDANKAQELLNWPDPRQERIMRVETLHQITPSVLFPPNMP